MSNFLTIKEASEFASCHIKKNVTASNISYLINYGRIHKHGENGTILVDKDELVRYYDSYYGKREIEWKSQLGDDLNWALSFEQLKEAETTKHVHRLHPYKGKFIPQLVEYFLDDRTDDFKQEVFFRKGDIVLDPFCGSGTTLVQANELGINAVGIDISAFNALISNVKVQKVDFYDLNRQIKRITEALRRFVLDSKHVQFENKLAEELNTFNNKFFPLVSGYYGKVFKSVENEIFQKDDKYIIYYVSALSLHKVEQYVQKQKLIDARYNKARFHMLMLFRILAGGKERPRYFNAAEMEKYCNRILNILNDDTQCLDKFIEVTKVIDNSSININNQKPLYQENTTKKLLEVMDEYIEKG